MEAEIYGYARSLEAFIDLSGSLRLSPVQSQSASTALVSSRVLRGVVALQTVPRLNNATYTRTVLTGLASNENYTGFEIQTNLVVDGVTRDYAIKFDDGLYRPTPTATDTATATATATPTATAAATATLTPTSTPRPSPTARPEPTRADSLAYIEFNRSSPME
jgi:hypothetical protein